MSFTLIFEAYSSEYLSFVLSKVELIKFQKAILLKNKYIKEHIALNEAWK